MGCTNSKPPSLESTVPGGSSVGSARSPGKKSKKPANRRSSGLYVDDSSRRSQEFEVEEDRSKSPRPMGGAARWRATQSNEVGASPDALNRARAAAAGSPVPPGVLEAEGGAGHQAASERDSIDSFEAYVDQIAAAKESRETMQRLGLPRPDAAAANDASARSSTNASANASANASLRSSQVTSSRRDSAVADSARSDDSEAAFEKYVARISQVQEEEDVKEQVYGAGGLLQRLGLTPRSREVARTEHIQEAGYGSDDSARSEAAPPPTNATPAGLLAAVQANEKDRESRHRSSVGAPPPPPIRTSDGSDAGPLTGARTDETEPHRWSPVDKIEAAKAAGGSHGGDEYTPSGAMVGESEMLKSARLWVETQRRQSELMISDADSSRRDSLQSSVEGRSSIDSNASSAFEEEAGDRNLRLSGVERAAEAAKPGGTPAGKPVPKLSLGGLKAPAGEAATGGGGEGPKSPRMPTSPRMQKAIDTGEYLDESAIFMHSPRMKSVLRTSVSDYADAEQKIVEESSAEEKRVNEQLAPLVSPRGKQKDRPFGGPESGGPSDPPAASPSKPPPRVDKFVAAPPRREGGPEVCESPRLRDKVKHFEKVGLIVPSPLSEAKSPSVSPRPGKAYTGKKW
mmetsp:Transcript_25634/g.81318  ORF Transcript_25634/g.81318 Transcript_25634/m.81318 type:complete len:629 (-) Transcript_25634:282-2168(-)